MDYDSTIITLTITKREFLILTAALGNSHNDDLINFLARYYHSEDVVQRDGMDYPLELYSKMSDFMEAEL